MRFKFCFSVFLIAFTMNVSADTWTGPLDVSGLMTNRVDLTATVTISGTCVNNSKAYLSPNAENHQEVVSFLLAAMMADKQIKLYCSDTCASTNRCSVTNVQIIK